MTDPNPIDTSALAEHYSHFRVSERLLLTGHSHQAWPDVAFEGQQRAWLDAAQHVDQKWSVAEAKAERYRGALTALLDDQTGYVSLGHSTHELVTRVLSALPLATRPRLVTTDGEFHSIRRQLDRLAEEGVEVAKVAALPASTLAERLISEVDDRTAAVLVSCILFQNAHIVPGLGDVLEACKKVGAELLLDAYHSTNVAPISLPEEGLGGAFIVGGGYKYMQAGEGNCWLRFPRDCRLRPVLTGWFSEFGTLADQKPAIGTSDGESGVLYSDGPTRFAGATYDPTSHYRAAAVLDFFAEQGLTQDRLRACSQHQIGLLVTEFDALDLDPVVVDRDRSVPLESLGGFLALTSPEAPRIKHALAERGVHVDHRGHILRLGPAPYLTDEQLGEAMSMLGDVVS
ncbi:MAG: kynureninase [Gemmatimonadota bacterium]|nr:kynureninase [Gemmatimonadota bacterium]MED5199348.1 kynureninase [Gemmatimonadota bacterium]